MKNFYKGMNISTTTHYLIGKMDKAKINFYYAECVSGDNELALKEENKIFLIRNLIAWLIKKGATLVCQDCGTIHNVKIISDLRNSGTLCPNCLQKRLNIIIEEL